MGNFQAPLVDNNNVYLTKNAIYAINKFTGRKNWKIGSEANGSTVLSNNGHFYSYLHVGNQRMIVDFDMNSGEYELVMPIKFDNMLTKSLLLTKQGDLIFGTKSNIFSFKVNGQLPDYPWPIEFQNSQNTAVLPEITPPIITQQPNDLRAFSGDNAVFSVVVSGTSPFDYLWYKNGKPIEKTNTPVLELLNVSDEDNSYYSVRVKNIHSKVASEIVQLTVVSDPPVITMQPKDTEVDLGGYTEFIVAVKGNEPFDYQWYKNGNIIKDGNKATLVIPSVSESDITIYSVSIKNEFGKAISRIAELKLKKPKITLRPPTIDASGRLVLIANGPPNRKVIFQFSNDLLKWIDQLTLPLSDGTTSFNVPIQSSPNAPNLFYRLKLVE